MSEGEGRGEGRRPTRAVRRGPGRACLGVAVVMTLWVAGCGTTLTIPTGPGAPGGPGGAGEPGGRGVPGFDTRDYPGDAAMRAWLRASPYRWVGFYLSAPCYTGTTWRGKRATLRGMGWGLAVLFVGEQDWPAAQIRADSAAPRLSPDADTRCTRGNVGPERGRADGREAVVAAAEEGFPPGTALFLDVERVDSVSTALAGYVGGWAEGVLSDGRYRPALYAHERNADALLRAMTAAIAARAGAALAGAGAPSPPLWVAKTGGFTLRRGPAESGFPAATVWQGLLDVEETWGGTTLHIDVNVATTASPSG